MTTQVKKIKVFEIEQITPGARHVWLRTEFGRIRKEAGQVDTKKYDFSEMDGTDKFVLVEKELLNWGKWLNKCTVGGLGFPSQSTLVTALQGSRSTTTPSLPTDENAERTERAVKRVETQRKASSDVLRKHYTRDLDTKAAIIAKEMQLPLRTYNYYLNLGRKKVEFFLKNA